MICTTRRCANVAIIEATESRGLTHHYCLEHLWQVEETDQVSLINNDSQSPSVMPGSDPRSVVYAPPVTLSEPVTNEDGFFVGFRITHPPGVECAFPPSTNQCSCGKMKPAEEDAS